MEFRIGEVMIKETVNIQKKWIVTRYRSHIDFLSGISREVTDPNGNVLPATSEIEGNLLLNEGITELLNLITGTGSPTAFNSANAYLGVGDSNTAASAAQTGLQAATNKTYVAMYASYPSVSGQTATWRSEFDGSTANHGWQEFTVANGSSNSAKNLNRKVSDQGTKTTGQVWTLDLQITLS